MSNTPKRKGKGSTPGRVPLPPVSGGVELTNVYKIQFRFEALGLTTAADNPEAGKRVLRGLTEYLTLAARGTARVLHALIAANIHGDPEGAEVIRDVYRSTFVGLERMGYEAVKNLVETGKTRPEPPSGVVVAPESALKALDEGAGKDAPQVTPYEPAPEDNTFKVPTSPPRLVT